MPNWKKVIVSGSDAVLNSIKVTTNITASNISASGNLSANITDNSSTSFKTVVVDPSTGQLYRTGSYGGGGGGGGTGNGFPFEGDALITGSLTISQSYTAGDTDSTALRLIGSGSVSQSGIFEVEGSAGPLFSVQDGLDGILMEVNNISGLPLFQVSSSNEIFINRGNLTSGTTTATASFANFSGSFQGDGTNLNLANNTTIPSSDPFPFTGDAEITGSLIISGSNTSGLEVRGPIQVHHSGSPAARFSANSDTTEEVLLYDSKITIEDQGYEMVKLSGNLYSQRVGVLELRRWTVNEGAVIIAHPSYTSYIQSSLLIGKTGTVTNTHPYKLDVNGDIKLGNGTDDSIEILGPVTASTNISSSATSTASFGTYIGDGSQLTNLPSTDPFPFTGDAQITGSLIVSGSSSPLISLPNAPTNAVIISGSSNRTRLLIHDSGMDSGPTYNEGAGIVLSGGVGNNKQATLEISAVGSTNGGSNDEQTFIRSNQQLVIQGGDNDAGELMIQSKY